MIKPKSALTCISIHALHEESDGVRCGVRSQCSKFQSTLSMRRATSGTARTAARSAHFNPRSP